MAYLNHEVVFSNSELTNIKYNTSGVTTVRRRSRAAAGAFEETMPASDLDDDEILAAYLSREPHIAPMMRLLLEMSEDQRRLALSLMQCVALGK